MTRSRIPEMGRYYAAENAIVIRRGLLLVEERSVLWHELAHALRGDTRCEMGTKDEARCDQLAARWAIPIEDLIAAWQAYEHMDDVADALKVTRHLLDVRVNGLHAGEQAVVAAARRAHLNRD